MAKYHKYVFDVKNRKFIGSFEKMYCQEDIEEYDSWHSSNLNLLPKKIHLQILGSYNYNTILDYGCGKGFFTHLLKKNNNLVEGWDISHTAIKKAKQYFGNEIQFCTVSNPIRKIQNKHYDLILCLETLSYISKWKDYLRIFSMHCKYMYLSLYIPNNPIGYVKSIKELEDEAGKYFHIKERIEYNNESVFLLLTTKRSK